MNSEEPDPIWDLLDEAPPRKASGAFVQNTLRRVRRLPSSQSSSVLENWKNALFAYRSPVGTVAAILLLGGIGSTSLLNRPAVPEPRLADRSETVSPEVVEALTAELEVFTMVSEFLAVGDPSELDDAALAELLF